MSAFVEATAEAERRHQEVIREEALIEWAEQFPGRKLGNFDGFVRAAAMRHRGRRPDPVPA